MDTTNNKTEPVTLPDKLSDLIDLAVADCERIERGELDNEHRSVDIDMGVWLVSEPRSKEFYPHTKQPRVCQVCMAGAVMLAQLHTVCERGLASPSDAEEGQYLDFTPSRWAESARPSDTTTQKLQALDDVRTGSLLRAIVRTHGAVPEEHHAAIVRIGEDLTAAYLDADVSHAPWDTYRKAASDLRALGY